MESPPLFERFLYPNKYESLLHFFRSDAFSLKSLKQTWHRLIRKDDRLYKLNGKPLLLDDGTKHPKEGRHMPGVKKLFQDSENSSKPSYIFGHMYSGVAAVIHRKDHYFAIPLDLNIQDGLAETSLWKQGDRTRSDSHVVQMIRNGYEAALSLASSYMSLDRSNEKKSHFHDTSSSSCFQDFSLLVTKTFHSQDKYKK